MNNQPVENLRHSLSNFDVLIITAGIWFLGKFLRYVFPPLFELLQETFTVTITSLGWTFSAFLFAYAAVQFPSGFLSDTFGASLVIASGAILSSIAALVLVIDTPFVVFVLLMVVLGVGTGVHKTAAVQLLSETYPARRGRVLGIFDTFGTFGGVVAPVAVVIAASIPGTRSGWRLLAFITGIVGLCFAVSFLSRVPTTIRPSEKQTADDRYSATESETPTSAESARDQATTSWRSYARLFLNIRFSVFVTAAIFFAFTYYGIVAFLPLYLTEEAGLTPATAGTLYSVLFIASISQVVAGEISDRIGTLPVIIGALGLATVSMAVFIGGTDAGAFVLGGATLSIGFGAHSYRPVRGAYLMESLPTTLSAGGLGIVRTLTMGAGAVAPGLVGTVSDLIGFRTGFWLLFGSVVVATLLTTLLLCNDI